MVICLVFTALLSEVAVNSIDTPIDKISQKYV